MEKPPTAAPPPVHIPGRPWPGERSAESGRLYHLRTPSGHYLVFTLSRDKVGAGRAATYGDLLATGYGLTPATGPTLTPGGNPTGGLWSFERLTLRQLKAYAKAYPPAEAPA